MRNVVIRADASVEIGTGHIMRCLTLAEALRDRGEEVKFICREHVGNLCDFIEKKGYRVFRLPAPSGKKLSLDWNSHAKWLGVTYEQDAKETAYYIQKFSCDIDWLVVDHYALDKNWESKQRSLVKHIMIIDDLADRIHDCDLLLDQNYYADMDTRYNSKVSSCCKLLLGPRYALLREEFRTMHKLVNPRKGPVQRILIFLGGMDVDNYTGRAIEAIATLNSHNLAVDVVIGSQHPCREQIESVCIQYGFFCHIQTNRMAKLMAAADLGIGAGGATCWERSCLGLPALIVSLAQNQIDIAKSLDQFGASVYLGLAEKTSLSILRSSILSLLTNQDHLEFLSRRSYVLVDGLGAHRLCKELRCQHEDFNFMYRH